MLDGLQDGTIDINEAKVLFRRHCIYLRNCCFQFSNFRLIFQGSQTCHSNGVNCEFGVKQTFISMMHSVNIWNKKSVVKQELKTRKMEPCIMYLYSNLENNLGCVWLCTCSIHMPSFWDKDHVQFFSPMSLKIPDFCRLSCMILSHLQKLRIVMNLGNSHGWLIELECLKMLLSFSQI